MRVCYFLYPLIEGGNKDGWDIVERGAEEEGRTGDPGARASFLPLLSGQNSWQEGGQNTGWMAWRQELSKMTSGGPGQCPGIWDSGIHKDMVTLERNTEASGRVWKACAAT